MNISISQNIDVLQLFLHDQYNVGPIDTEWVAEQLNEALQDEELRELVKDYGHLEVRHPENLSRFTVAAATYDEMCSIKSEPHYYVERCYNKKELKKMLPDNIYKALEKINDIAIVVTPEK